MKWSRGGQNQGYTIVETMIVLAVSSTMLIGAMTLIGGRQARAEFTNAVRNFESVTADIASDVATGYYVSSDADAADNRCRVVGANLQVGSGAGGPSERGASKGCIFIGVGVHFAPEGSSAESFTTYGLVGRQFKDGNESSGQSRNVNDSDAEIIPGSTVVRPIGSGVTIGCVRYSELATFKVQNDAAGGPCASVGSNPSSLISFITTFQGNDVGAIGGDVQEGGSSQVDLLVSTAGGVSNLGAPNENAKIALRDLRDPNVSLPASTTRPAGGLFVCLQSNGSDQYAIITMGGQSSRYSSTATIYAGKCTG